MQNTVVTIFLFVDDIRHINCPFFGLAIESHIVSEDFNMMEVKYISLLRIQ
jgi:hypothetical protein